jgi:redox-sensitive bicupin YhaK (pirin superfamily)
MITIRKSKDRGHANHGWLNTWHTFSFGDYHDPKHMHFRSLRVINEDYVAPGQGFGMHPHQDMEILTWIVSGALQHKDSMGNGEIIRPGDLQHISAGTGVLHSEFNPSTSDPVHLLQIWIMPEKRGLPPGYSQTHFPLADRTNRLRALASADGRDGSIRINQDATLMAALIEPENSVQHEVASGRSMWVQVVAGPVEVNGQRLEKGDAAAISGEPKVAISAEGGSPAEVLVFDLA